MNIAKLHAEGRKFRTVQGKRPVRILCTDKAGHAPVVFLENYDDIEFIDNCLNDGSGKIEPIPVEREGWLC